MGSALFEGFEFFESAGPVGTQETGEAAVGKDLAVGLALGAVVGFVVRIADALDGRAAGGAGLIETPVDGHVGAEGGDFFGEGFGGFCFEAGYPEIERVAGGGVEALPLVGSQLVGLEDGREVGGVEDLVGVGVADAGEDAGVGEGSLEGAVFCGEGGAEVFEGCGEDVEAAWIDFVGDGFVGKEMEGSSAFGAGFGEEEGARGEVEGGEVVSAAECRAGLFVEGTPVEAAGDHEVKDEPDAVVEFEDDAFADPVKGADGVTFDVFDAWVDGAEEEWAGYADLGEGLAYDAGFEGGEISGDVGEFWHGAVWKE